MNLEGKSVLVVGGSRGLGRGAAEALVARGAHVAVLGRSTADIPGVTSIKGDATDAALAERELHERKPDVLVICAGAAPVLGAFHELSWEQFQTNWNVDAKLAFVWLRQALRTPLARDAHVIVISSGAAIQGSPVSGGYAPAKRAQWFLADYAATEIKRAGLGIRVSCVLPNLNPSTELGRAGIAAYAARAGISDAEFAKRFEPQLTPDIFGAAIVELATNPTAWDQLAYRVGGRGLVPVAV